MEIVYQLMMGVSVAACAGCRTWLPMFVVGVMARTSHVELNPAFGFLSSNTMLVIFGIASVLELLGDKVIAVDHFLDAVGTIARPVAGTILSGALLTKMDAPAALLLGLIAGGAPALVVHAAKTATRAHVSTWAALHGGVGNFLVSVGEDVASLLAIFLGLLAPVAAFVVILFVLGLAVVVIYLNVKAGVKVYRLLFGTRASAAVAAPAAAP